MDKKLAKKMIDSGKESSVLVNNNNVPVISFARATNKDVEWIEKMNDEELVDSWVGYIIMFEHCFSIRDLQVEALIWAEICCRKLDDKAKIIANKKGLGRD